MKAAAEPEFKEATAKQYRHMVALSGEEAVKLKDKLLMEKQIFQQFKAIVDEYTD